MATNLVMLWYCSVSTGNVLLRLMVVCICSYRWSLSDLHRTRLSSTLEGNCPIPHTAKGPETSQTEVPCECTVKTYVHSSLLFYGQVVTYQPGDAMY